MTPIGKKIIAVIFIILLYFIMYGVLPASGIKTGGAIPALIFFGLAGLIWKKMTKKDKDSVTENNQKNQNVKDTPQSDIRLESKTDWGKEFVSKQHGLTNDGVQIVSTENRIPNPNVENIEPTTKAYEEIPSPIVNTNSSDEIAKLMRRGHIFLEATEWQKARVIFNEILEIDPENAHAYIGLLCVNMKVTNEMNLGNKKVNIGKQPNFIIATRFADVDYKKVLDVFFVKNQNVMIEKKRVYRYSIISSLFLGLTILLTAINWGEIDNLFHCWDCFIYSVLPSLTCFLVPFLVIFPLYYLIWRLVKNDKE